MDLEAEEFPGAVGQWLESGRKAYCSLIMVGKEV